MSGTTDIPELEGVLATFSSISASLVAGYESLASRAEHVERELSRTNRELEAKVAELDAMKRRLEAILQALPIGVVVRDDRGRVRRANGAALGILGVGEPELLSRGEHEHLLGEAADGLPREIERADGRRLVVSSRYSTIPACPDSGDERDGSVEILDDRTEVSRLTERLHAMDRMAALGTMAAGIAHEIRNPMNAVMGFAGLLRRELPAEERAQRWAALIVDGCKEANAIIAGVLSLADPERMQSDAVDGAQLLESAVRAALPPALPDEAPDPRWRIQTACSAPPFRGDRIKLRQAVRNLVANSVAVLPDGGDVRAVIALEESQIVIRVADSGPGLTEEQRQRAFDPFYTTRAEGTGLGLSLVAAIARVHGGTAQVSPGPGPLGGAELVLRIPYSPVP